MRRKVWEPLIQEYMMQHGNLDNIIKQVRFIINLTKIMTNIDISFVKYIFVKTCMKTNYVGTNSNLISIGCIVIAKQHVLTLHSCSTINAILNKSKSCKEFHNIINFFLQIWVSSIIGSIHDWGIVFGTKDLRLRNIWVRLGYFY